MHLPRRIETEWLDELPADDARAVRSRRDLRRVNALMLNSHMVARELRRIFHAGPPRSIAEIGAGDGSFMQQVAAKLGHGWRTIDVVLVDQQRLLTRATGDRFAALGWRAHAVEADVFAWLAQPADREFDVVVANLFLHHFDNERLIQLLSLVAQRTRVLIACEPRRSGGALLGSHLLGVIGCNDVTRHDAVASVHAGFNGHELSNLWPHDGKWRRQERAYGLFSHCFVAERMDSGERVVPESRL
ncbi:MAG: methyltransferase domain-containing protein [Burkholderiales bacterium]